MKVKEESEKAGLKLNNQKPKIMASSPNTRGKSGSRNRLIFLESKITMDSDWRHEIKRRLLLRRKVMTNPGSTLKSKDITLPTKVLI